jgi:glyoxylase-like metal-dependent hydrolase (beta-lactamase superfamily II)
VQVTKHIHALKIPFKVPISPERAIERFVFSYIVFTDTITLIDTGVKGAEAVIFDYITRNGGDPRQIKSVILSHSHPDHIGSVRSIVEATGCRVLAHKGEQDWIEDTAKQFRERPVPGFPGLVGGPVKIDEFLADGDIMKLGTDLTCRVIHTSGHSKGSITLMFDSEKAMFTGDSLPVPNDMPIYDDFTASLDSINRIRGIKEADVLLQSWEEPLRGYTQIQKRIDDGILYLQRIHESVRKASAKGIKDPMEICRIVVGELGLPPFAANPLVAASIASNLAALV